jgi:hypothetical protein
MDLTLEQFLRLIELIFICQNTGMDPFTRLFSSKTVTNLFFSSNALIPTEIARIRETTLRRSPVVYQTAALDAGFKNALRVYDRAGKAIETH